MERAHGESVEKVPTSPTPHEILREEDVAPVTFEADPDSERRREELEERLGIVTRRQVFLGVAATAIAASAPLEARAAEHESLEGRESIEEAYRAGLKEMREHASSHDFEILKTFIIQRNGRAAWQDVPITQRRVAEGGGEGIIATAGNERLMLEYRDRIKRGDTVEQLHTHPFLSSEGSSMTRETAGTQRVPPSPVDIVGMSGLSSVLDAEERGRAKFTAVAPEGVWRYGSSEGEGPLSQSFRQTATSLESLRETNPRVRREAGQLIRRVARRAFGRGAGLDTIASRVQDGTFDELLVCNPIGFLSQTDFVRTIIANAESHNERPSEEVRTYLEGVGSSRAEFENSYKENDPDGLSFYEAASVIPDVQDADTNFEQYRSFWADRGVALEYEAFE